MQGWRKNMEDAYVFELNLTTDMTLLGVFDGHGGMTFKLINENNRSGGCAICKESYSGNLA